MIKKKISGILQETIFFSKESYLIIGIGININNNPIIQNFPTTNMSELSNKTIDKLEIENNLKHLFEKSLSRIYKIKNKIR